MTTIQTLRRLIVIPSVILPLVAGASLTATPASAATGPWWGLSSTARPSYLPPAGQGTIVAAAANIGDAPASGPVTLSDTLPPGITAKSVSLHTPAFGAPYSNEVSDLGPGGPYASLHLCSVATHQVSCTYRGRQELEESGVPAAVAEQFSTPLRPFRPGRLELQITVKVAAGTETGVENEVSISGGGAPSRSIRRPLAISEEETPFGIQDYELRPEAPGGALDIQAGSHPYQLTTFLALNQTADRLPAGALPKDLSFPLPTGLVGAVAGRPRCTGGQFLAEKELAGYGVVPDCSPDTAVGVSTTSVNLGGNGGFLTPVAPIFNLQPAAGEPARFGYLAATVRVILDTSLGSGPGDDYGVTVSASNITQNVGLLSSEVTFWGTPGDPSHDPFRGNACLFTPSACAAGSEGNPRPLLTLPTACLDPLTHPFTASMLARSWAEPPAGPHPSATYTLHEEGGSPLALGGCNRLSFSPAIQAEPTSEAATSPTGLNFDLNTDDEGLANPEGLAQSQIKKTVVTLPQGFTTNPSVAEGLQACSEAQFEAETLNSEPGAGCPNASKVGDVEAESPLVEGKVSGSLFVARQHDNPFHSLLALYMVFRNPEIGVIVKSAGKIEADPQTGQLTTIFDELPQLPISHFHLAFRQGQRSPLITPPACGTYTVTADLYPYSNPTVPLHDESSFQITKGPEGLPCPSGNTPPFHPNLEAGTINPLAGSYSPFFTKITRKDSEQEITHFSIKLPPGVAGKLAGIPFCPEAGIAQAEAREHEGGGGEEEAAPSCPAASQVGHTLVGSGVGNVLAYAPGKFYLAGPYHGSRLSFVSITAAKVGPFDLGTVVVRFALRVDPETAEVFVDAQGSDPIPHIVDGIPIHLRDIRGYIDRPQFTYNPTSCAPTFTASTLLGSGLDFASAADDQPVTVSSPFQAADCAALAFKPKLKLSLKGSTKRGGNPALKAVLTYPYQPSANIAAAQVTLPPSEFLDNAHIGTVCTRVQFKEGTVPGEKCPAASVYGYAKAVTPVFSEPLEGPVFLRSSTHELPDLLAALHNNQVDIALAGHTEGVHGGIRNTFEAVPDAPVTKFTLELKGAKKGLLQNSTNLCTRAHRANALFTGHNGKVFESKPVLAVKCKGGKGKKRHRRHPG